MQKNRPDDRTLWRLILCHHLVRVAEAYFQLQALRDTAKAFLGASTRNLVCVDATGNRRLDVYTPKVTEFNSTNAWKQNFTNGNENNNNKNNNNAVRAVRK